MAGLAIFTGILLAAAFLAASCSGSAGNSKAASGGGDRSSDAGSVKVVLSWDGPASGPVFKVVMDTHSVDLDGFDLSKLAALRTDGGVEVAPTGWDAPKGGHHREGALTFPATVDGRPLLGETVRGITIVLKDVAAPERSFQWTW
ncbi:MAG: hypothetical protein HYX53_08480 [Chloroflexi bacterium]|nr:hypothetical protein [Chloroflexota bacterium]